MAEKYEKGSTSIQTCFLRSRVELKRGDDPPIRLSFSIRIFFWPLISFRHRVIIMAWLTFRRQTDAKSINGFWLVDYGIVDLISSTYEGKSVVVVVVFSFSLSVLSHLIFISRWIFPLCALLSPYRRRSNTLLASFYSFDFLSSSSSSSKSFGFLSHTHTHTEILWGPIATPSTRTHVFLTYIFASLFSPPMVEKENTWSSVPSNISPASIHKF